MMSHRVVVNQIQFEGCDKLFGRAMLEAHVVVGAYVVDQRVEPAELLAHLFNGLAASLRCGDFSGGALALPASASQCGLHLLSGSHIVVQEDKHGGLPGTAAHN